MKLTLTRDVLAPEFTLGMLHIDGKFFGFVAEDTDRLHRGEAKVKGKTAIPAGSYIVRWTYSPKFGKNIPEVLAVPGFQGIRIHSGNDSEDTEGCLLPGLHRDVVHGLVTKSRDAVDWLYAHLPQNADSHIDIGYILPTGFEQP